MPLPRGSYAAFPKRAAFVRDVLARLRAIPGVESAGYSAAVPLVWKGGTAGFMPEGDVTGASLPHDAVNRIVSPGYMETIGMTLRAGRFFDERDTADHEPVAIISARMAEQYWPGQDALGRTFTFDPEEDAGIKRRVVGIVENTVAMGIDQPVKAEMYFPIEQSANNWIWPRDLVVRSSRSPDALAPAIRAAVRSIDPVQPVTRIVPLDEVVAEELESRRLAATLLAGFAALTLVLAAVGTYGVLAHAVSERGAEIGVRLALGGTPPQIRWMVVSQGARLVAAGLVAGVAAGYAGSGLVSRMLFGVSPHDLGTFVTQAALLAAVCLAAAYVPARRASRIDPLAAIRKD